MSCYTKTYMPNFNAPVSACLRQQQTAEALCFPVVRPSGVCKGRHQRLARLLNSFSERELTFAICRRPSVRLSVCMSVVCLSSVTFVHPTQEIENFGNVSMPFGTLAICDPSVKILRRSSQGNLSVEGLNQRGVEKCSDFGPFQG